MIVCLFLGVRLFAQGNSRTDRITGFIVDSKEHEMRLYWKDTQGDKIMTFDGLKHLVEENGKELLYAMNGGMFKGDFSPVGLYIENGKQLTEIDTSKGNGNFYLLPNGVFYLTKSGEGGVIKTGHWTGNADVAYATQSGPMLVIDGEIHPAFNEGSNNVHIRNGVGILPDGQVLMAISKERINLYDFATFFKEKGCQNALYLDGFVSRVYSPMQGLKQKDGRFGVMIGVVNRN